jgi:hypothetical protein
MTIQMLSYSLILTLVTSPCLAMQDKTKQPDCLICYEQFKHDEHLISCSSPHKHTYHYTCMLDWLKNMQKEGTSCSVCYKNNIDFTDADIQTMDKLTLRNLVAKEIIPTHYYQTSVFDDTNWKPNLNHIMALHCFMIAIAEFVLPKRINFAFIALALLYGRSFYIDAETAYANNPIDNFPGLQLRPRRHFTAAILGLGITVTIISFVYFIASLSKS